LTDGIKHYANDRRAELAGANCTRAIRSESIETRICRHIGLKKIADAQKLKRRLYCTAKPRDLGVDFRPVDTVIQVAFAKGRFNDLLQTVHGRRGHRPGDVSTSAWFLFRHTSLELLESRCSLKPELAKKMLIEKSAETDVIVYL
jgi:hypothetical protein